MNQSFGARRQVRVPAIVVGVAVFLQLILVPAAFATITDAYGSAYDLTTALSSNPFTFSDSATSVTTFTRDSVETDGVSVCGNYQANPTNTYSVWYTFTAPSAGWLTIQTMNTSTNYDTVIEVWKTSPALANSIGCNDDAIAGNRRSELTLQVAANTAYVISVRRHGTATMTSPMLAFDASFSASREFFVDQTLGSDANTGSRVLPFRTVGHAEAMLPATGGIISIVDPGVYNEAVTIDVPTDLRSSASSTIASVTLKTTPVSATSVNASTVTVQPGAKVQEGVDLAETAGWLWLANGTYTETVTIARDLTVQAQNEGVPRLTAPGGTPLTLSGGAVTVKGLNIRGVTGVVVTGGAGHTVTRNNITGNSSGVGLDNQTGTQVSATTNWWGSAAGPPGAGDNVTGNVAFRPWCDTPLPTCANTLGAATRLQFTSSPGTTRANSAFATQPVVKATDDAGTLDPTFTGAVTIAIKSGTGTAGATLGGTVTMSAVAGIADFSGKNLAIDYVGQNYRLTATSGGLNSTATNDSAQFPITADRLVVTASPTNPTTAGAPLAITVAAQDGAGHTDATFTGIIALAIQTNPTSATLAGTSSKAAASGTASFGGAGEASIAKPGTGYTLRASSGTLASDDSQPFDIVSGAAAKLVFNISPSNSTAGVAFPTQPTVEVQDAAGNIVTTYNGNVTVAIGTNPGGGTLSGTATVAVSSGQATFTGLSINKAGTGYTLVASSTGLTGGTSTGFTISPAAATALAFVTTPGNTRAGVAFTNQPTVEAQDAFGNRATSFSGAVTLAIKPGTGTVGATLGGTATVNAVNGLATFSGLSIDRIGTAYQFSASASGLTGADSAAFDITANGLTFTLQPVNTVAGQSILVKVAAQDGQGNTDTSFTGNVTLVLKGSGRNTPTLFGTTTVAAVAGVADFTAAGLNIRTVGTGYILTATTSSFADADSSAFAILPAAASKLVFITQPTNPRADAAFAVTAQAQDQFGNVDTTFTGVVSLALQINPGGGTLGGTTSAAASNGVANFPLAAGLNIDRVGVGYVLRATSGALSGDSLPFNITANRLLFVTEPGNTPVGNAFRPALVVQAVDRFGTIDTTFVSTIALAIKSGTGTAGASLRGTNALAAQAGSAIFSSVSIDRMGTNYQLNAAANGLIGASSVAFNITRTLAYAPLAIEPPHPDLIGSFTLSKAHPSAFEPVLITATITNTGEAPSTEFWVDFYINPQNPPNGTNQPWDKRCGASRCRYGIAWFVAQPLAPGQSVTLTSTRASYYVKNTDWPGSFNTSKLNLYMYVDSWNPTISYGAVYELHEDNNRSEMHLDGAAGAPDSTPQRALPPR